MKTDFDILGNKELFAPVVFRSEFNEFKTISPNQAWSLFFTAGKQDQVLGYNRELGAFFTNLLIAIGVSGIIWTLLQ
jgi:hypothetical protein